MQAQDKPSFSLLNHIIQIITVIAVASTFWILIYYLSLTTDYIPLWILNYVFISVLILGGYLIIRIVSRLILKYGQYELQTTHVVELKNLFQISALVILTFAVLFTLGVDITSALVGAGFVGIVLGLAAQTVIGNVFAGLALLGAKLFKVGDRLTINVGQFGFIPQTYTHDNLIPGYTGTVMDIGLTHTRIMGDDNVPISYPNSVLLQAMIFNHGLVKKRTVRVRVDLNRDIPIDDFRDAIEQALQDEPIIDHTSPVEVYPIIISEEKYNVAVEAWIKGSFEEPGKAVLICKAIDVAKKLRNKAGTDIYKDYPVRIGDQVLIRGEYGTVEEVTPRITIIKTWDNRRQIIPNNVLDNEVVINYTRTELVKLCPILFFVTYDTNLDEAKYIMIEEAKKHPSVLDTLEPIFQVLEFQQNAIELRLLFMAKDQPTAFNTACDLRFLIKRRFDKAGIKLSCAATYISPGSKINVDLTQDKK